MTTSTGAGLAREHDRDRGFRREKKLLPEFPTFLQTFLQSALCCYGLPLEGGGTADHQKRAAPDERQWQRQHTSRKNRNRIEARHDLPHAHDRLNIGCVTR